MSVVLDASALLAYLQDEPGGERVKAVLGQAVLSAVNWAEVVGKAIDREVDTHGLREDLEALGLRIESFSAAQADISGHLKRSTKRLGLSLGDRACLALAIEKGERILTADRIWERLRLGVGIEVIR